MATVTDLAEAKYPAEFNGNKILPMEGTSLRPAFTGQALKRDDAIYWEHEGNAAVRVGDWKLVRLKAKGAWELYDLKKDRTEQHDLAEQHPQRVKELEAKWLSWAERCNVKTDGLPVKQKKKKKAAA